MLAKQCKQTKGHFHDHRRDSYLCIQENSLQNINIITNNLKNTEMDVTSMDVLLMPDISEIAVNAEMFINVKDKRDII